MTTPNESVQDEWAELRAAAGLATPGPWCADVEEFTEDGHYEPPSVSGCVNDESYILCVMAVGHNETQNAKYIALASPDRILALLVQRDDLAAELAGLTGDGWVSVEKVLPEHGEEVWCVCNFGVCYAIARIDYDNKLYFTDPIPGTFAYENVTYWMPKPSPPQTATEEKK
jgi:hypothetical protein